MTALDTLVAALRERYPATDDLIARLALNKRRREPLTLDRYYLNRAAGLVSAWLDQLNDDELELRLAYDRAAYLEFADYEDEETGEVLRRRVVSGEQLGWALAEQDRRRARRRIGGQPTAGAPPILIPAERFAAARPVEPEQHDAAYYEHHRRVGGRRRRR